jgi:HSP20 family protein
MTETTNGEHGRTCDKGQPPMDRIRNEMERWLDVARTTGERALETLGLAGAGRASHPAIDVIELDTEVVVMVDLPGVAAENVHLSLVGNMLSIKAFRHGMAVPETAKRHVFERMSAQYERSVPLPAVVDPDAVHAETRDGLLTVTLKKPAATAGRSIPVTRGGAHG